MKKFYTLALAAVATLSMSAGKLYLRGDGTNLAWETDLVVESANGQYVINFESLGALKLSTTGGADWNEFNAGGLYADIDLTSDAMTQTVDLAPNTDPGNINMPWRADWKVTIPEDLSSLTITTTTPKPTGPTKIYLRGGDPIGWEQQNAATYEFDTPDGVYYFFDVKDKGLVAGTNFKIAGEDWSGLANYGLPKVEGNSVEIYPGEEQLLMYNSDDMALGADYVDGTIVFILPSTPKDPATCKFLEETIEHTAVAGIQAIEAAENAEGEAEYFNLQGVRVMEPAAGLYLVRKAGKVSKVIVK